MLYQQLPTTFVQFVPNNVSECISICASENAIDNCGILCGFLYHAVADA